MGTSSTVSNFDNVEEELEAAAKREAEWEKIVEEDIKKQKEKEERRRKRQELIAAGKAPILDYEEILELSADKAREEEKPNNETEMIFSKVAPKPIQNNLANDTAEFEEAKAPHPVRYHEQQASPFRKEIALTEQEAVKTSPLARGCSNVYDLSFENDTGDGLSQLDSRGTIDSVIKALGDDVRLL